MTIIKANNCLFGGYLSVSWEKDGVYIDDKGASIFTLRNSIGIAPTIFAATGDGGRSAHSTASSGPTFGSGFDIHISNDANSNLESYSHFIRGSYARPYDVESHFLVGQRNFTPDEVEVYIRQR